jgi:peptide/nickel transport system substrate-binding protein
VTGSGARRTLRIASATLPNALDRDQPAGLFQFANIDAHLQLYDTLVEYSGASLEDAAAPTTVEIRPALADRWERLDGGARYRFFLRAGVYSAFDHELTAEDVCWTWRRSLALGTVGAWIGTNAGLRSADQIQAIDRYTVEFRLPEPTTILPHLLTVIAPTIFDSQEAQKHATADDPEALSFLRARGAGFGAYVVDDSTGSNGLFRLRANPRYWRGSVAYETVEFVPLTDPEERWQALRGGDVDVAVDLHAGADEEQHNDTTLAPMTLHTQLWMNCTRAPFDRLEVRQAVAQAIPYDRIIREAYGGRAKRMQSCIADTVLGHTAAHARWEHRPDEARALLLDHKPLPAVELAYHEELPAFPATARIIAEGLRDVGFEVDLVVLSGKEHGRRKSARELDLFLDHYWPITIDGRYALGYELNPIPGHVFDYGGYRSEEIDRLITASLVELDDARLQSLLSDVQRLALRDVPFVPLAQEFFVFALGPSVVGYRWYPLPRLRCRDLRPAA